MAISALNINTPLHPQNTITPQKSLNVANTAPTKISNSDGDTLKLSGTTQNNVTKTAVYSPPKPVNKANDLDLSPQIKGFLDKIANGTATAQDLKDMQSMVQKELGALSVSSSDASPIKNFLLKVANGTATDMDIKNMQGVLKQPQQQVTSITGSGNTDTMKKS